jgi:hypothetical protein
MRTVENFGHLAYLCKKGDKVAKRLKLGTIERAQKREHHYLLRPGALEFNDIQEWYAAVTGIQGKPRGRESLGDRKLIGPFLDKDSLEHNWEVILYAHSVHHCSRLSPT